MNDQQFRTVLIPVMVLTVSVSALLISDVLNVAEFTPADQSLHNGTAVTLGTALALCSAAYWIRWRRWEPKTSIAVFAVLTVIFQVPRYLSPDGDLTAPGIITSIVMVAAFNAAYAGIIHVISHSVRSRGAGSDGHDTDGTSKTDRNPAFDARYDGRTCTEERRGYDAGDGR